MKFQKSLILLFSCIVINISAQNNAESDSTKLVNKGIGYLIKVDSLSKIHLDSAALMYEKAIPLFQKAKKWDFYIGTINGLVTNRYFANDFQQAKVYSKKAIDESALLLGKDNIGYATAINNYASFNMKSGNYDQSIKLYTQSSELHESLNFNKKKLAKIYQNLATNYRLKEENQKALAYRKKALEINLDSFDRYDPVVAFNYKNIGLAFKEIQQYDSSFYYLQKSNLILKKSNPSQNYTILRNLIMTLHGLAETFLLKKQPKQANVYIQKAIKLQNGDNAFRKAFSYELLAKKFIQEEKLNQALKAIKNANRLAQLNYRDNSYPLIARKYIVTSEVFNIQNQLDSALVYIQKALQVLAPSSDLSDNSDYVPVDQLLAKPDALNVLEAKVDYLMQYYKNGKNTTLLHSAFVTSNMAIDLIRNRRQNNLSENAKNELAKKSISIYEDAIIIALMLHSITNDPKYKKHALKVAENNKALLLLESINEQFAYGNSTLPDSLIEKEKELSIDLAFCQKNILEESQKKEDIDQQKIKTLQDNLLSFQQEHDILISQLEENYPKYHDLKYNNDPTSIDKIRSELINKNTALIEYFIGEENIYLFCLTSNDLDIIKLEKTDFTDQISDLRNFVTQPPQEGMSKSDLESFWKTAYSCFEALIKPAVEKLSLNVNELFIVPDGNLAYVPFDILLTKPFDEKNVKLPDASDYLLSKYSIGYDYSATLLVKNTNKKNKSYSSDFIAFAPSFQGDVATLRNCEGAQLSQLKCNKNEVDNIGTILNGHIKSGQEATSINFTNSLDQNRIIHLATHACVNQQNSLLNKIYFSDNPLTLLDFNNTQLKTELVVLSACNTGIGKIQEGEGVMSIARGFMAAGSPSTMLSLWSVDDCSTSDIMHSYYKYLKSGNTKNRALQKAKIEYLNSAPTAMKHPFYWGAFVQFGNVEPLTFSSGFSLKYWMIIGFGVLILGLILYFRKSR